MTLMPFSRTWTSPDKRVSNKNRPRLWWHLWRKTPKMQRKESSKFINSKIKMIISMPSYLKLKSLWKFNACTWKICLYRCRFFEGVFLFLSKLFKFFNWQAFCRKCFFLTYLTFEYFIFNSKFNLKRPQN